MAELKEVRPGVKRSDWISEDGTLTFREFEFNPGVIIKTRRKELRMTQAQVAEKVGVSKSTVSRWESGDIEKVPSDFLPKIAEALQCSPLYLIASIDTLYPEDVEDTFENDLIAAYRKADEKTQRIVRQLLDL